ncbi:hypothetical protein MC885_003082, partial [Smutsia gigantea]
EAKAAPRLRPLPGALRGDPPRGGACGLPRPVPAAYRCPSSSDAPAAGAGDPEALCPGSRRALPAARAAPVAAGEEAHASREAPGPRAAKAAGRHASFPPRGAPPDSPALTAEEAPSLARPTGAGRGPLPAVWRALVSAISRRAGSQGPRIRKDPVTSPLPGDPPPPSTRLEATGPQL